ncbi:MAG: T9SS type A sorting domain-containing protein [Flavobacteriales bacterium]
MNNLYTSALAVALLTGTAMAQSGTEHWAPVLKTRAGHSAPGHQTPVDANRDVVWSNDFATPSDWTIAHDGNFNADFQIGVGLESQGDFGTPAIESTTAANGYAMYDSDAAGNTTTDYEQAHITTAAPIDLTGHPNVILSFETQYRRYNDEQTFLVVSTDGNFPTLDDPLMDISAMPGVFRVWEDGELTQGVSPGNPTVREFNISAAAGDAPQVWVRLQFTGIYGYTWYIDDISIYDQYQYDSYMLNGFVSHRGDGSEFGRIPSTQLGSQMNVGAWVINKGYDVLTNVTASASSTAFATVSANAATLNPGDTLFFNEWASVAGLATGAYTVDYTVTSDQSGSEGNMANNNWQRTFEVTDDMYSLDQIGGHPEGTEVLTYFGTNQFTGGADGVMGFTYYPIIEEFAVTGMQIELANGTVVGGTLQVSLHDSTTLMADDPTPIEVSNDHEVTQADLDAGVINVAFDNPVTLDPGAYYAGITMYSNENANDIRVLDDLTVPQPGISSALFLDATLYSNINALALRLSSDPTIGMEESRLTGVGVYPNPSTGLVNVAFVNTGKYTVDVLNSLGQTVQRTRMNGTSTMDLSTMPKGVYSLRISNGTATTVDRVVLQ